MKVTKTISVDDQLWKDFQEAVGEGRSASYILSLLAQKWMLGKVDLTTANKPMLSNDGVFRKVDKHNE